MNSRRKLTYLVATTIDGYITGPSRDDPDFFLAGGDHSDALVAEYPEVVPTHMRSTLGIEDTPNRQFDTVLQGRGSWELGNRVGITNAYEHLRSVVFSRTITASPDPTVEFVATEPVAKVRELKQQPGTGIWLCGGAQLAAALRPEIDELLIKLHPLVTGAGVPLFDGLFAPEVYRLGYVRPFDSGVIHLRYARDHSERRS